MDGQTNYVLCEFKSRSIGSLKQHMKKKLNVFNMTIVQILTQQVERVTDLESDITTKEQLMKKAEVIWICLKKHLKDKKKKPWRQGITFNDLIIFQKQKAVEETKLVEELN